MKPLFHCFILAFFVITPFSSSGAVAQLPPRGLETPDQTTQRMEREDKARSNEIEAGRAARARKMDDLETEAKKKVSSKNPLFVPGDLVGAEDREQYAKFLEQPNAGIFRIFSNPGCKDSDCKSSPAARSDYSFINRQYVSRPFQEIGEFQNTLFSDGLYSQGIFVSLGDVPIENVGIDHPAFKFLVDFKTAMDIERFRAVRAEIFNSVESNGYKYANKEPAQLNATYAARIIQYKLARPLPTNIDKATVLTELLNSPAYSTRADIILVFRVVRVDGVTGYSTLVWKEMRKTDAPELVLANEDLRPKN